MDPVGWISGHCHVSSSQEEMLNTTAPYLLPNLAPPPSESEDDKEEETVVVMMSVPETSAEDEFRTPPERHSHSLTSSNEEVDCGGDEDTVDLSRDSEVFGCECRINGALVGDEGRGAVWEGEKPTGDDNAMDDEDLVMEDGRVPSSGCCVASRDAEPIVAGNHGLSVNPEMIRTFGGRDEGAATVDELLCSSKVMADEVERVTCTAATLVDDSSLHVRKLPSSFCTGNKKDGATRNDRGLVTSHAVGHSSARGAEGTSTGGADDGSGRKPSEASEKKEPNEEEQTENILNVLGLLAKPLRPVYTEKVDIIDSAIKAGITFPRPSWWPDDSDDDAV